MREYKLSPGVKARVRELERSREIKNLADDLKRYLLSKMSRDCREALQETTVVLGLTSRYNAKKRVVRVRGMARLVNLHVKSCDHLKVMDLAKNWLVRHQITIGELELIYVKDLDEVWMRDEAEKCQDALARAFDGV